MQFTRLRIAGFKSFLDPVEMRIESGQTGIVGPNGCGKSNLIEALRWVMGESSARRMRGGGMDDVIFAGTDKRPARNLAEVVLTLDDAKGKAPSPNNEQNELEISRKIVREAGSDYRINGRPVRARDVQILFADAATGAHSPALVSQGQIMELISAKPSERRMVLEEAAGVSGMHARRHEAELRLRAAEANLMRVEDLLGSQTERLDGLKKQARQAARYRNLSERIRKSEAAWLVARWLEARRKLEAAKDAFHRADADVATHMAAAARISAALTERENTVPSLRQTESIAATKLAKLVSERETLEAEARSKAEALARVNERLTQGQDDLAHERALLGEADAVAQRLAEEQGRLAAETRGQDEALEAANADHSSCAKAAITASERLTAILTAVERDRTTVATLEREAHRTEERLAAHQARLNKLTEEQTALKLRRDNAPDMQEPAAMVSRLTATLAELAADIDTNEAALAAAEQTRVACAETLRTAMGTQSTLEAERDGLTRLLAPTYTQPHPPVIRDITVKDGLEQALAAALGEALEAATDTNAPKHWRHQPFVHEAPGLPPGCRPLSCSIEAPEKIARALAHIGLIEDGADLPADPLPTGISLVTREGDLHRWDGLTVTAGAPSPAAERLRQQNRLKVLATSISEAEAVVKKAKNQDRSAVEALDEVRARRTEIIAKEQKVRTDLAQSRRILETARRACSEIDQRQGLLTETLDSMIRERDTAIAERDKAAAERADAPDQLAREPERQTAEDTHKRADAALDDARIRLGELTGLARVRGQRLITIAADLARWETRRTSGMERIEELDKRAAKARELIASLNVKPEEMETKRQDLLDAIGEAERERDNRTDALIETEGRVREIRLHLKQAEEELGSARETRARLEAETSSLTAAAREIAAQLIERVEMDPEEALDLAGIDPDADLPPIDDLARTRERLIRERDNIGPVNLRAEAEAEEMQKDIDRTETDKTDIEGAIASLRQAIAKLNREARERLMSAFIKIDNHFRDLFARLFDGGHAHLEMTEEDDPLTAGFEIFACPPGKRLQSLSLLSGGEQALTAIALTFAMFLTNPAPICVLDEVDAPLDESNVGRFCRLLEDIARTKATRFLVITHHRITMSRMDRLYGVTMSEQGISQLVSVDLSAAEKMHTA